MTPIIPRQWVWAALAAALASAPAPAKAQVRPDFVVHHAMTTPSIDGVLNDEIWSGDAMSLGEWVSYNPLRGGRTELRTEVRVAYDTRNIYFAFHAFDPEPGKVRTTISRRDTTFSDDWVAMSLDSAGTGQTAYHLFVNPSGIQMDAVNTSASGEQFEADLLWESVGRTTADGYIVEIRLPLQSIRFTGGDGVRMGIMFFRKVSRTGVSYSFPEMPPGSWVFENHAHLVFEHLEPRRLVELLPSVTYGLTQARTTTGRWGPSADRAALGLSAKLGITSNMILDATVNPDFSQVESDAFQVQVNQRFPTFFSEKRPFFMEGMGLFNLAGTGFDGNMRTSVHTRRIIDPMWGSKLTGTIGKMTVGLLSASDHTPEVDGRGDAVIGHDKAFTIARATYALGGSNYVGALVSNTEYAGRYNRVQAADMSLRFTAPQQLTATLMASQAGGLATRDRQAAAAQVSYQYGSRRFSVGGQAEHYGRDFQMDTAFYNRTGFTTGWSNGELHFYPKDNGRAWIRRVSPVLLGKAGVRRRATRARRRDQYGAPAGVHASGLHGRRASDQSRGVERPTLRHRRARQHVRRRAGHAMATPERRVLQIARHLLRRCQPLPGAFDRRGTRGVDSGEPALRAERALRRRLVPP